VCRLVLATWLVALAAPVWAQQSIEYASVSGRVTDPSAGVVAGAQVEARHTETNVTSSASTDDDGRFRFPYLRVGLYALTIRHPGFADVTRDLTLVAGAAFELPVVLTVAGLEASVIVTGQTSVLETARSQIAGTVSEREVRSLPLNGRNLLEVALLVPGVSPTNIASTQLFPETSAVPGVTLSVTSQRNLSNNFIVDGLSANDDAAGLSGITYGVDAIEQFQVITSGGQAELGRALGGYVNIVTKSGTNRLRGAVYDYVRDDRLNAANALTGTTLPMSLDQLGASLGGPISTDRMFYFANLERKRLDQTGLTTIAPTAVAAVNARLAAVGYQGRPVATGIYENPVHASNFFARLDHRASGRDQLSIRYSRYAVDSENARGAGGLSAPSASSALRNQDHSIAVSNTLILSARTVVESRAQWTHGNLAAPPTDITGPAVSIAGVASFGRLSNSPTGRVNSLYQIVNNLSHQAGAHAVRVGADVLVNDDRISFPRAIRGTYAFSSLASFLAGTYNNAGFTQTFGVTDIGQTNPNVGIYAQDEWKVGSRLTLNLGVRYDLQFLDTIATDTNNVSPRLGIAWTPFESRRTLVRGGAGLFYDRVPLRALANALLSAGNTTDVTALRQISVSLSPTQAGAPTFPAVLPAVVTSVTLPNLTTMDRHLQNAHPGRPASRSSNSWVSGSRSAPATTTCAACSC
jgi:outer membrane receptor protein involved in Fe transport